MAETITFRVSAELRAAIEARAELDDTDNTSVITAALRAYLDKDSEIAHLQRELTARDRALLAIRAAIASRWADQPSYTKAPKRRKRR